jgi:hypothetical protein
MRNISEIRWSEQAFKNLNYHPFRYPPKPRKNKTHRELTFANQNFLE